MNRQRRTSGFKLLGNRLRWLAILQLLCVFSGNDLSAQQAVAERQVPALDKSLAETPDPAVQQWIVDLSSQEFVTRRQAFLALWKYGKKALPALQRVAQISDQQTVSAGRVLELLIRLEITPEDNDELMELMQMSRGATQRAIQSLTQKGHWRLASELLRSNEQTLAVSRENLRPDSWCFIVQSAFEQGDATKAWPVVSQLLKPHQRYYLAHLAHQPAVPYADPGRESDLSQLPIDEQALVHLYAGDAERAWSLDPSVRIKQRIIYHSGRWEWLKDPAVSAALLGALSERRGHRVEEAAYAFLAGDRARRDELLQSFQNPIDEQGQRVPGDASLINALLICGEGEKADKLLGDKVLSQNLSYYSNRLEYGKALQSFGIKQDMENFQEWLSTVPTQIGHITRNAQGGTSLDAYCDVAALLTTCGYREQAQQLWLKMFDHTQKSAGQERQFGWLVLVFRARDKECRALLLEYMEKHEGQFPVDQRKENLSRLYDEWSNIVDLLWIHAPKELLGEKSRSQLLERLWRYDRTLVQDVQNSQYLEKWFDTVLKEGSKDQENAGEVGGELSRVALKLGLRRQAFTYANAGGGMELFADVAESLTENNSLDASVKWWRAAITQDPRQHTWIRRLIEVYRLQGEIELARKLEREIWLRPILNEAIDVNYFGLADHYETEGDYEVAREYSQTLVALFETDNSNVINSSSNLAQIDMELEDFTDASRASRIGALSVLMAHTTLPYSRSASLSGTQFVAGRNLLTNAASAIEQGKIEEALDCIVRFESIRPADIEISEHCYKRLVQANQLAAAEQLLERCTNRMLDHIKQWPKDSGAHNNYAWMLARCNVRLEEALEHATLAVELSERSPTYVDTLAEIQFRLGHVDIAQSLSKECIATDPRHAHYRLQLDRFRAKK